MKDLEQITVVGLGLLGGSITLAVLRSFPAVKVVGYTHRCGTRRKARQLAVATEIVDDIGESVSDADLVILATEADAMVQVARVTGILSASPPICFICLVPVDIWTEPLVKNNKDL